MLPNRPRFTAVRTAALGTVAALALLAACEAKMPTSADVDQMDASRATATRFWAHPPVTHRTSGPQHVAGSSSVRPAPRFRSAGW